MKRVYNISIFCGIIIFSFILSGQSFAQLPDDGGVDVRVPRNSLVDSMINDKEFHYVRNKAGTQAINPKKEVRKNEKAKRQNTVIKKASKPEKTIAFPPAVAYIIVVVLLVILLYFIFRREVVNIFTNPARIITINDIEEDVHTLDFDYKIKEAISSGQYRFAIRLYYLKTLKILDDKGYIEWQPQKTNREYLFSLRSKSIYIGFDKVTAIFNIAWYGEFPVDESTFRKAEQEFINFNNSLG